MPSAPVSPEAGASPARRVARALEHTLLRADATAAEIDRLCAEARSYEFHCVCVNGSRVARAYDRLQDSAVKVAATVAFPLGAMDLESKRFETEAAIDEGAHEIDVVMNIGRFLDSDYAYVLRELRDVVEAADERTVKVIIETCLLSREQKLAACQLVRDSGARVVKTSTGFNGPGATIEDVRLLREAVGAQLGVKAAGGIRDAATALAMLDAGANRLGTSAGIVIMRELAEG